MFGFVTANLSELTPEEKTRYNSIYCGICRQISRRCSQSCRLALQYDMAFLAMLHMSLYEPEEAAGNRACALHPIKPKCWVDNEAIGYAADMNVALAYYKAMDDWHDDKKLSAKAAKGLLGKYIPKIKEKYPRQCSAMESCLQELSALEKSNCPDPDLPAGCFGRLMAELMVLRQDMWEPYLRNLGHALGRFIYLADASMDYQKDEKKGAYNPFLAMGTGYAPQQWEQYLVLDMAECAKNYECLPLVQDKKILDNILYSGIWVAQKRRTHHD